MKDIRILVVEDHTSVRTLMRVVLEGEGYRVMEAADGDEAIVAAEEAKPNLIVLDLMMPELDGEHVIERIRQSASISSTPIVVVTAKEEAVGRMKDLLGDENVLVKPFENEALLERVSALAGPGTKPPESPWKEQPRRGY